MKADGVRRRLRILVAGLFCCVLSENVLPQTTSAVHHWIYLKDKGTQDLRVLSANPKVLGISSGALKRRAKVLPPGRLIDERDLPVAKEYVDQLRDRGFTIRTISRWLNAVSVQSSADRLLEIRSYPFVQSVEPVTKARNPQPDVMEFFTSSGLSKHQKIAGINYGPSMTQLQGIKVPEVHNLGIYGTGVVVGMIDDGFNNRRSHNALKGISVLAEYDWIQADSNTSSENDPPGQGDHGCYTLSALAGFDNGNLIGPAFAATLILAKTEVIPSETQIELDNYVAALEWMERLGAEVVSTSLGYDDLDPFGRHNPGDIIYGMKDGRTAVTSRAATIAASKGVLLVTAMGNEGPWRKGIDSSQCGIDSLKCARYFNIQGTTGSLITPADADSIIAVGATHSLFFGNQLASFSSTGPTADGRVKPEVVAQGVSVVSANPNASNGYVSIGGTSLSTPLVAGVAALILSAHPELSPMQVRQALVSSATQVDDSDPVKSITSWPNNYYGYGLVNALDAVLYHGLVFSNQPIVTSSDTSYTITTWIKSKNGLRNSSLFLFYKGPSDATFRQAFLSPSTLPNQFFVNISKNQLDSTSIGYFSALDNSGMIRTSPANAPDSVFSLALTPDSVLAIYPPVSTVPQDFILHPNYPNPFNGSTTISFDAPTNESAELAVFNILGQRIKTIFSGNASPGRNVKTWDGTDEAGQMVASGAYIYRLKTPTVILSGKLLYLR